MTHKLPRVEKTCPYIIGLQPGIALKDDLRGVTRGKHGQNMLYCEAASADNRFASKYLRVHRDSLEKLFLVHFSSLLCFYFKPFLAITPNAQKLVHPVPSGSRYSVRGFISESRVLVPALSRSVNLERVTTLFSTGVCCAAPQQRDCGSCPRRVSESFLGLRWLAVPVFGQDVGA